MPIMKNERKVCDEKKFGSNASFVSVFSFFSLLVYVASTRSRLSQVRDKKKNDRCRKIQGVECKRVTRGKRGEKV